MELFESAEPFFKTIKYRSDFWEVNSISCCFGASIFVYFSRDFSLPEKVAENIRVKMFSTIFGPKKFLDRKSFWIEKFSAKDWRTNWRIFGILITSKMRQSLVHHCMWSKILQPMQLSEFGLIVFFKKTVLPIFHISRIHTRYYIPKLDVLCIILYNLYIIYIAYLIY